MSDLDYEFNIPPNHEPAPTPKTPGPYDKAVADYRGVIPGEHQYRNPKNRKRGGPRQEVARIDDRDGDHWGIE